MDNATFRSFLQVLPPVEFACVYGSSLHPSNHDKVFLCFVPIINFCLLFLFSIQGLFFFFFHSPFSCCFNICSLFCVFGFLDNHDRLYSWRVWSKAVAFWGTNMWWCFVYLCIWPPPTDNFCFSFYSYCWLQSRIWNWTSITMRHGWCTLVARAWYLPNFSFPFVFGLSCLACVLLDDDYISYHILMWHVRLLELLIELVWECISTLLLLGMERYW